MSIYLLIYKITFPEQQVTVYAHNDYHNDWIMIPEHGTEIPNPENITEPLTWVKNGDIVRLLHPVTKTYLYSKNIKAPVTQSDYHFEVRYDSYVSRPKTSLTAKAKVKELPLFYIVHMMSSVIPITFGEWRLCVGPTMMIIPVNDFELSERSFALYMSTWAVPCTRGIRDYLHGHPIKMK
jgi:hypothetical protein